MEHESIREADENIAQSDDIQALNAEVDASININSLLNALQALLALDGKTLSVGALRDIGGGESVDFTPREAVAVLLALGYKSNFGRLKVNSFHPKHLPLIAFTRSGAAVLVEGVEDGLIRCTEFGCADGSKLVSRKELETQLQEFVVLAKRDPAFSSNSRGASWFWGSLAQGKWLYAQVLIAAALTNVLGLSTSLFIMVVYDRVVPNQAIESLVALTTGMSIALIFDFLIKTMRAQFVDRAGQLADGRMARIIFDKLLSMRLDQYRQKSGAMASVVREFDTLREFFTSATLIAVVDLPFVFFFIWVISIIAGPLALVPLAAVPAVIFAGLIIQPFLASIAERSMQTNMSKQGALVEALHGLETIQATGSGRLMRKRFEDASSTQSELGFRNRMLSQFAINSAATVQQVAQIATIFFGVFLIQDGVVTMGAMIAAVILGGRTLAPLSQLASALSRANSARQAYKSLSELMRPDDVERHNAKLSRPKMEGFIELKNLTYSFPQAPEPTIKKMSLKIKPGQRVAIVGRMGSGKSTIARLLSGILEPSSGAVLVDGVDVRQIDPSDLRRNLGVMLQETWLFSGSVRENVQMGYYEYPDEHILKICKIAGVDQFISKHPAGYDLQLRERGEGLSGGQRQSINLARALLHEPNILILDEPTSSMDQATEAAVIENLKEWSRDKTLIMITHRNSLLQISDRVLVVDDGEVITDTTPERLRSQQSTR